MAFHRFVYLNRHMKNGIGDACIPQPREIVLKIVRYRKVKQYKDQETFRENSIVIIS